MKITKIHTLLSTGNFEASVTYQKIESEIVSRNPMHYKSDRSQRFLSIWQKEGEWSCSH